MPQDRVIRPGFKRAVYAVVKTVPFGFVTTYGDVARELGSPNVARHVGWALSTLRQERVPWHRVINARGSISIRGDTGRAVTQHQRLVEEGQMFDEQERLVGFVDRRWTYREDV